jgi:hypothetical protein
MAFERIIFRATSTRGNVFLRQAVVDRGPCD